MHRRAEKEMRAERCEAHDHEVALTGGFGQLRAFLKTDDPCAVAAYPFPGCRCVAMSLAEIDEQRDFCRRQVTLANRRWKSARTRHVTFDEGAQLRARFAMRHAPAAQFGIVLVDLHGSAFASATQTS
jgi:hypothetical protein